MVQRPIVKLVDPSKHTRPTGSPRAIPQPRGGSVSYQKERFQPTFERLERALESDNTVVELRSDPQGIAPERALVFVTATTIQNFRSAAQRIGLVVVSESEHDLDIPDEFESAAENGKFDSVLYTTMPTLESIKQFLSLWNAFQRQESLPKGYAPWKKLFELLVEVRVWGPEDRLPQSSVEAIEEVLPDSDDEPVKLEIEMFPVIDVDKKVAWTNNARALVEELGGTVLDSSSISESGFVYEAMLVELATGAVRQMLKEPNARSSLATLEGVQIILPQTIAQSPIVNDGEEMQAHEVNEAFDEKSPLRCALLDGTAVAAHPALADGLAVDDINNLVALSQVSDRYHATSMASLILRGDLIADGQPLVDTRILNVPVLIDTEGSAVSNDSKLFVDVMHYTLTRLFSDLEHDVFVVNLSIGIPSLRFAGKISPLARLLDWWAYEHGVLFIISAGNITDDLVVLDTKSSELEDADVVDQRSLINLSLRNAAHARTLLSPAECLNGITVGALSEDLDPVSTQTPNTIRLEGEHGAVVAIASAQGLGKLRSVKPDVVTYGGVHEYNSYPAMDHSLLRLRTNSVLNGLNVASPNFTTGPTSRKSRGTSCATALTTRAVLRAAESLIDEGGPYEGVELPRQDIALITRALTVNSANWTRDMDVQYGEEKELLGANSAFKSKEQVAKKNGFGVLSDSMMCECSQYSATLVGLGTVSKDEANIFSIPLPPSLSGESIGRTFRFTIAWFSPIDSIGTRYKMAQLEAFCEDEESEQDNEWGLGLKPMNLDQKIVSRGSVGLGGSNISA